uniref:Zinc finger and BTB domain containing 39 n=1 Tax=Xiphophorus couchianus TaxID=32473 RepID=A0A3B5M178_9TELE
MMELPDFSKQLLQQLWTLRREGLFCDCTILVGDSSHRAHKVVLAHILLRSLLDSSDTISIDTSVVSSQEFGALLEMIYTGRLPLGKHNASRIVAAADSLQMFDVAVGFKKVLSTLVGQKREKHGTCALLPAFHASSDISPCFLADSEVPDDSAKEPNPEEKADVETTENQSDEDEAEADAAADSSFLPSSDSNRYPCRWCKKTFNFKCRMLAHVKRCSLSQECRVQCPQCPKKLPNQRALQRHCGEFHPKEFHKCSTCSKVFQSAALLEKHNVTHSGSRPFSCQLCNKSYQLEVHMRWHTKEKPYSCAVCRKSFTTVSMLKRHHRIHTGEKPFRCHVCGKCFNQSAHLNTHYRLHTRERASWSRAGLCK